MQGKMLEMLAADREAERRNLPVHSAGSRRGRRGLITWCRDQAGVSLVRAGSRVLVTSRARVQAVGLTGTHLREWDR
jgi:hypothetical protein